MSGIQQEDLDRVHSMFREPWTTLQIEVAREIALLRAENERNRKEMVDTIKDKTHAIKQELERMTELYKAEKHRAAALLGTVRELRRDLRYAIKEINKNETT